MPKRATKVRLSEKEQEGLTRISRRYRSEQQLALRARIILAAAQGQSNAQIARELDIHVDTARLWRDRWVGLQPHHFRYWLNEVPDAQRDKKIREGCEVYANAPQRAQHGERTLSRDELTGVQAVERKHPDLPMQPGHVLRREFEYIRHGTLSWFINFDVVSGRVIEPSWGPTRTEEDALAHLQRLIASDPGATKWHIIVDNLNIHQSESLVYWVAEREEIPRETLGVKGKSGILQSMESRAAFC